MQGVLIPLNNAGQGHVVQTVVIIGPFNSIFYPNRLGMMFQGLLWKFAEVLFSRKTEGGI